VEFVANWREHRGDEGAPLVVISGHADLMTVAKSLHARAAFRKPFDVEALVAAVSQN
jgi:DNA-binding NtrC family response regulator